MYFGLVLGEFPGISLYFKCLYQPAALVLTTISTFYTEVCQMANEIPTVLTLLAALSTHRRLEHDSGNHFHCMQSFDFIFAGLVLQNGSPGYHSSDGDAILHS